MSMYIVQMPGLWWDNTRRCWIDTIGGKIGPKGVSSYRSFRTAQRCWAHVDGLKAKGHKVSVERRARKKGEWRVTEYANFTWGRNKEHDDAIEINERLVDL